MTNEELSNKLEEKRFEMERETYLVMEVVDGDNILEMANEMIVYRAKMEMIDEMKARDTFKSPEYYSRLRREVKEGMGGSKAEISESLIAELDHKVKALKRFYR